MAEPPITTYDELPYDDLVFAATHPGTMATVAALHGLDAPPLDRCRVLELGCAAGANLMPMALAHPNSQFIGIDLSPKQIERGKDLVAELRISNLDLQARDVVKPTDDLGMFDYIIAHGLYSWVPPVVQDRIFDLIRRQLKPQGLAYISYNVYPGWHLRGIVRDALTFHAGEGSPATRAAEARAYLEFLVENLPAQETIYATIFRGEAEGLRNEADSYLFHEFLESDNRPVYFHEFAAQAMAHELQFLAEALPQPLPGRLKPDTVQQLTAIAGDRIRLEQYLDFLRGRAFRRSVLCHASAKPEWNGMLDRLPSLAVTSEAKPQQSRPDAHGGETFLTPNKIQFTTNDPCLRAALWQLWESRPAAQPFSTLVAAASRHCPGDRDIQERLAHGMLQLYLGAIVELHRDPPALASQAGPHPDTSRLIQLQARRGNKKLHDLRNRSTNPDPFARYVLANLDGTMDRAALVETLARRASANEFQVRSANGEIVADSREMHVILSAWVDQALVQLAQSALLTA